MNELASDWGPLAVLVFCRVGGCLMLFPGWGSIRIPARVRLFIAIGICLCLMPSAESAVRPLISRDAGPAQLLLAMLSETVIGLAIGLAGRLFMHALHFSGMFIASLLGIAIGGPGIDDPEPSSSVADLLTLTATALFFMLNLHAEVIVALLDSYHFWPPASQMQLVPTLEVLSKALTQSFRLALQLAAPFVIYSVLVNLALGLLNRLIPMIPFQIVGAPLVAYGGCCLLLLVFQPMQNAYVQTFEAWLRKG